MLLASMPSIAMLYDRLDARVDAMMERGLLQEVADMRVYLQQHDIPFDSAYGITQAIGRVSSSPTACR